MEVILFLNIQKPSQPQTKPIPTRFPTPIPPQTATVSTKLKQAPGFENELGRIRIYLPYRGKNFSVEYVVSLNLINAKVKADSQQEYFATKTQIEGFFKSKGVMDICKLNIFWIPQVNNELRQALKATKGALITSGCYI